MTSATHLTCLASSLLNRHGFHLTRPVCSMSPSLSQSIPVKTNSCPLCASWAMHPILQWDLRFVRWMVRCPQVRGRSLVCSEADDSRVACFQACPWLGRLLQRTTSRYRTQDLSLLLWSDFCTAVHCASDND